jgi:4-hydroxy-tetrahydrodipicolinate synthase
MAGKQHTIEGVIPAVITPFGEDGTIDFNLLEQQVDYLTSAGAHGFFIGGTTSEGAYLTREERKEIFTVARRVTKGTLTLYVVFLRPHTDMVLEEMRDFAELEPDYVAAVTPFYYGVDQNTLYKHFMKIADAAPAPLVLYNIPQNTYNNIAVETTLRLAENERIVGIKDSSGAIAPFANYTRGLLSRQSRDGFSWLQGEDLLDAPSLLLGAPAVVTGLGNVFVEPYVRMFEACRNGDREEVLEQQRFINSLAGIIDAAGGKVIPAIKTAAEILGRASARMRIDSMELNGEEKKAVRGVLEELELV